MWSRFVFLSLCCLTLVSCLSQGDKVVGQTENVGSNVTGSAGDTADKVNSGSQSPNGSADGDPAGKVNGGSQSPNGSADGDPAGKVNNGSQSTNGSADGDPAGKVNGGSQSTNGSADGDPAGKVNNGSQSTNGSDTEIPSNNDMRLQMDNVCYPKLGCFNMGYPWRSLFRLSGAPQAPEVIQTTIEFFSRENLEKPKLIPLYPEIQMGDARFDPSNITAVIVHGYLGSGNAEWMMKMKDAYLKKFAANVMIVDWRKGAQLLSYYQVIGNIRLVGKQMELFVKYLIEKHGADPGKFHLIGHSLGAHICAYMGKGVKGIGRLTALDPAQPAFEGFDSQVRLDQSDAEFVDAIHTDAKPFFPLLGLGMIAPVGHVDFYMNGGFHQPGCLTAQEEKPSIKDELQLAYSSIEDIFDIVSCSHIRSHDYLIEAFQEKCIFWGHQKDIKNVLRSVSNSSTKENGTAPLTTCSVEKCIPMGFATKDSPLRGVFVVKTNPMKPYCIPE